VNALVQEVIPPSQFTGANAAVLVGVQSGMLIAGAFVGFLYNTLESREFWQSTARLISCRPTASIKCAADTSRRGEQKYPREYSEATEATAEALETEKIRKSRKQASRWPFTPT